MPMAVHCACPPRPFCPALLCSAGCHPIRPYQVTQLLSGLTGGCCQLQQGPGQSLVATTEAAVSLGIVGAPAAAAAKGGEQQNSDSSCSSSRSVAKCNAPASSQGEAEGELVCILGGASNKPQSVLDNLRNIAGIGGDQGSTEVVGIKECSTAIEFAGAKLLGSEESVNADSAQAHIALLQYRGVKQQSSDGNQGTSAASSRSVNSRGGNASSSDSSGALQVAIPDLLSVWGGIAAVGSSKGPLVVEVWGVHQEQELSRLTVVDYAAAAEPASASDTRVMRLCRIMLTNATRFAHDAKSAKQEQQQQLEEHEQQEQQQGKEEHKQQEQGRGDFTLSVLCAGIPKRPSGPVGFSPWRRPAAAGGSCMLKLAKCKLQLLEQTREEHPVAGGSAGSEATKAAAAAAAVASIDHGELVAMSGTLLKAAWEAGRLREATAAVKVEEGTHFGAVGSAGLEAAILGAGSVRQVGHKAEGVGRGVDAVKETVMLPQGNIGMHGQGPQVGGPIAGALPQIGLVGAGFRDDILAQIIKMQLSMENRFDKLFYMIEDQGRRLAHLEATVASNHL